MKQLPGFEICEEQKLQFNSDSRTAVSIHPLEGLAEFGPYSNRLIKNQSTEIKIAAIHPASMYRTLLNLVNEVRKDHKPRERKNYLRPYPGFKSVFGVDIKLIDESKCVQLNENILQQAGDKAPHLILSEEIAKAIRTINAARQEFDVLFIVLPDKWSVGFEKPDENFDLHDFIKALLASSNIPSQLITENALTYKCRCSVMWRLSIAIYVKTGGVPWKLHGMDDESAFIGLSYAMLYNDLTKRYDFITCCSQIFDSDGTGLEFIAYETEEIEHRRGENPFLSRAEIRKIMARSLALYQKRHFGRTPKKIIVHKTTHFTPPEIEGCFDAFPSGTHIELLQITQEVDFRGINIPRHKQIGGYPVYRISFLQLGHKEILLWTQGVVEINDRPYYKEGRGIPSPLKIVRHAGQGGWFEDARAILGLTKMNWNHDGLYDRLPVTLGYASILATTVKRMGELQNRPYEFRFFM